MARFRVEPERAGARLDYFVAAVVPGLSAAAGRRLVESGAVRVDGRPGKKGARLAAGQTVEIDDSRSALESREGRAVSPNPTQPLAVLRIDPAFVAVDKQAGIPSHPQAGGETGTAANAIVARFPECVGASSDPREGGLCHRLDTGTSGVLIAARTPTAWTALRAALSGGTCEKTYLAEVVGAPPGHGRVERRDRTQRPARRAGASSTVGAIRSRLTPAGRSSSSGPRRRWCASTWSRDARTRCAPTWRPPVIPSSATSCTAAAADRCASTPGRFALLTLTQVKQF